MVSGTADWETKLAAAQKRPLYGLVIDDFKLYVLSFDPTEAGVATVGGYGVLGYGIAGYGN